MKFHARLIFECRKLIFKSKHNEVLENLALHQQLAVQQRRIKRPKIKNTDRLFGVRLSRICNDWRSSLIIVKPPGIIGWHKRAFESYWIWQSRRVGRPMIDWELIKLIRKLKKQNKYINEYYNVSRTHMSLQKDSPVHRPVQTEGNIVSKPILCGLHHVSSETAPVV